MKRLNQQRLAYTLLSFGLLVAACGDDAAVTAGAGCRQSADCGAGESCVAGACVVPEAPANNTEPDVRGGNNGRVGGETPVGSNNGTVGSNNGTVGSNNGTAGSNNGTAGSCDDGSAPRRFYRDEDGDGFGQDADAQELCAALGAYRALQGGDCDDEASLISPAAEEVCDGVDNSCDGAVDEGVENACGGCAALPAAPGAACGCGGAGVWACDGEEGLRCEGAAGNACGGCATLEATPGEACGGCGVVSCAGSEATACAEQPANACGGCGALASPPGASCGVCGLVACDGAEATRCDDPGQNACGGCAELEEVPGTRCGTCGEWTCAGGGEVSCAAGTVNACGGCAPLEHTLGTWCGTCGLGLYGCDEQGGTTCQGEAGCPEGWVRLESGSFQMGSPSGEPGRAGGNTERQHEVTLTRPLMALQSEVPQWAWEAVMDDNPADRTCELCPVESVEWWDALRFANALSTVFGLTPCYTLTPTGDFVNGLRVSWSGLACEGFRLPTEAEWEFLARAGTTTAFYSGGFQEGGGGCNEDRLGNLDRIGWYCNNASGTRSAAQRAANAWQLYDVSGNVAEWVWDARSDYPSGAQVDPTGALAFDCSDTFGACPRVVRGGSWDDDARACRSAARGERGAWSSSSRVGLRLVRTIPADGAAR